MAVWHGHSTNCLTHGVQNVLNEKKINENGEKADNALSQSISTIAVVWCYCARYVFSAVVNSFI